MADVCCRKLNLEMQSCFANIDNFNRDLSNLEPFDAFRTRLNCGIELDSSVPNLSHTAEIHHVLNRNCVTLNLAEGVELIQLA